MPYRIDFVLIGLPSSPNSRRHFRVVAKENAAWYRAVKFTIGNRRPVVPLHAAKLTLTRISSVEPDRDNLCASFKPVIDGLRYAKVLIDDKRENIGTPEYLWEKGKPGKGCIRVQVESIE